MKMKSLSLLSFLTLVGAITSRDRSLKLEGATWLYYERENEFHSHIGPLKFKNGKFESVEPLRHGTILTLGTYTQTTDRLKMEYYVISMYSTPECLPSEGKFDRDKCLAEAKKSEYKLQEENCIAKNSDDNLFYTRFFLCESGAILGSPKSAVRLNTKRKYQGSTVLRMRTKGAIGQTDCMVYESITPNLTTSQHLSNGLSEGQSVLVLGKSRLQAAGNDQVQSDWLLIFVDIEPIFPAPLWVKAECVGEP